MSAPHTRTQLAAIPHAKEPRPGIRVEVGLEVCLSELMARMGESRIPLAVSMELVRQLAEGVARTWGRGKQPPPIEPDAVYLSFAGEARLDSGGGKTGGKFNIRRRYQSPEMKSGGQRNEAADVYGLSALLYELVTGTPVLTAMLRSPLSTVVPAPSKLNPGVDDTLDKVLLAAVQFDPTQRTRSAGELAQQLAHCLEDSGTHTRQLCELLVEKFPEHAPAPATQPRLERLRLVPPPRTEDHQAPVDQPVPLGPSKVSQEVEQLLREAIGERPSPPPALPAPPPVARRPARRAAPRAMGLGSTVRAKAIRAAKYLWRQPRLMVGLGTGLGFLFGLIVILAQRAPAEVASQFSAARFAQSAKLLVPQEDGSPTELKLVFGPGEEQALTTLAVSPAHSAKAVKTSRVAAGPSKKVASKKVRLGKRGRHNGPPPPWLSSKSKRTSRR